MMKYYKVGATILSGVLVLSGCGFGFGQAGGNDAQGNRNNNANTVQTDTKTSNYGGNNRIGTQTNNGANNATQWLGGLFNQGSNGGTGNRNIDLNYGISSWIENHITEQNNRKVLVLGDTILVGIRDEQGAANRGRDAGNNLAGTKGTEGNVNQTGRTTASTTAQIRSLFGGGVRVLTITDESALDAMDRVEWNLNADPDSPTLGDDLQLILQSAYESDQSRNNMNDQNRTTPLGTEGGQTNNLETGKNRKETANK